MAARRAAEAACWLGCKPPHANPPLLAVPKVLAGGAPAVLAVAAAAGVAFALAAASRAAAAVEKFVHVEFSHADNH